MTTYTAALIVPVTSPPLQGGTITVDTGRIVSIDPHGRQTADIDLGDVAVIPGLVNAHTHLDLSGARGLTPLMSDFAAWLRSVIAYRRTRTPEQVADDIEAGRLEAIASGTVLIGDIRAADSPINTHEDVTLFREVIGLSPERLNVALFTVPAGAKLSPHASYSVRHDRLPELLQGGNAIHLAETPDELDPQGSIAHMLRDLGVWRDDAWTMSVEEIARAATLIIHGNYLKPDWLRPGQTVVYCPRTHAAFGHPRHPVKEFLDRGVNVALGTDSLASNPDLNLWNETRWLMQHRSDLGGETILRMATLNGAIALGFESEVGSLEPGKLANSVAMPLSSTSDPYRDLFDQNGQPVQLCDG